LGGKKSSSPHFDELLPLVDVVCTNSRFPALFAPEKKSLEEQMLAILLVGRAHTVVTTLGAQVCVCVCNMYMYTHKHTHTHTHTHIYILYVVFSHYIEYVLSLHRVCSSLSCAVEQSGLY
jgi:hypothetical protein